MTARSLKLMTIFAAATAGIAGCSNYSTGPNDAVYKPNIPTTWASAVTNAHFPLVPGTTYQYQGQTAAGLETVTIEVLSGTKLVNGVAATIVRDRVYLSGNLIEETLDWYAQDGAGNVWYLGEDSKEIQNGQVLNTDGSWEWNKDGALPGIIMWADPAAHIAEEYRQEFYEGEAEDFAKVVAIGQTVDVPLGHLTNCIKTEDWNSLESGGREFKFYCPGVGLALEVKIDNGDRVELLSKTP